MSRPSPESRGAYREFIPITTRWMDNDIYGHVNNVHYYSYFDTAVNSYLIKANALDIHQGKVIGFVVESQCNYFSPMAFPQAVTAGLRVGKLGSRSVCYEIGLFVDEQEETAAKGHFTHVYVNRADQRPVALPENLRNGLEPLLVAS